MSLCTGSLLESRYVLEDLLGEGATGSVYLARDQYTDSHVAIKVLRSDLVADKRKIKRFIQEGKILADIDDANILKVLRLGLFNETPFIVMEYVAGRTLEQHIKLNGPRDQAEVCEIASAVCSALVCAHAAGIVHRDVKPANVIVGESLVKLVDFGVAAIMYDHDGAQTITRTNEIPGSLAYMAPELFQGQKSDARSDIYAVGCLMYEMLAGSVPVSGAELSNVGTGRANKKLPMPSSCSKMLWKVISKAMAIVPDDRYQTAADMLEDLREAAAQGCPPPPRLLHKPLIPGLLAAFLLLSMGAYTFSSALNQPAAKHPDRTQLRKHLRDLFERTQHFDMRQADSEVEKLESLKLLRRMLNEARELYDQTPMTDRDLKLQTAMMLEWLEQRIFLYYDTSVPIVASKKAFIELLDGRPIDAQPKAYFRVYLELGVLSTIEARAGIKPTSERRALHRQAAQYFQSAILLRKKTSPGPVHFDSTLSPGMEILATDSLLQLHLGQSLRHSGCSKEGDPITVEALKQKYPDNLIFMVSMVACDLLAQWRAEKKTVAAANLIDELADHLKEGGDCTYASAVWSKVLIEQSLLIRHLDKLPYLLETAVEFSEKKGEARTLKSVQELLVSARQVAQQEKRQDVVLVIDRLSKRAANITAKP